MSGVKQNRAVVSGARKSQSREETASKEVKTLREAVSKTVGKNIKKITGSLLKGAMDGKAASAKLMIDLARLQQGNEAAAKNGPGQTVADKLAAEPQWRGGTTEEDAELDAGSREPEG